MAVQRTSRCWDLASWKHQRPFQSCSICTKPLKFEHHGNAGPQICPFLSKEKKKSLRLHGILAKVPVDSLMGCAQLPEGCWPDKAVWTLPTIWLNSRPQHSLACDSRQGALTCAQVLSFQIGTNNGTYPHSIITAKNNAWP